MTFANATHSARRIIAVVAAASVMSTFSGCATWSIFGKNNVARNQADDVGPNRENRREQVAQDFDKRRDDAQFNAAATAWQRGDATSCEQTLQNLLERNPKYLRARLLLADLYVFNGDSTKAIDELTKVIAENPKDAVAHHSLAEALDAAGRHQEGLPHYEAATQLDPKNEVFALSFKSALGVLPTSSKPAAPPQNAVASKAPQALNPAAALQPTVVPALQSTAAAAASNQPTSIVAKPTPKHADATDISPLFIPATLSASTTSAQSNAIAQSSGNVQRPMDGNDYAWRLGNATMVPLQQREFVAPSANLSQWIDPLEFNSSAAETAPAANAPALVAATPPQKLPTSPVSASPIDLQSTSQAQPSLSAHPAAPVVQAAYPTASVDAGRSNALPLDEAVAALAKGDTKMAIDAATRGLSRTPDQAAPLYRLLGTAHYRQGEYAAAQAALAQALSLDKTDALTYFLMGSALAKQNEHEAAAKYFAAAARLDSRFAK